jgi:hypothetical protein
MSDPLVIVEWEDITSSSCWQPKDNIDLDPVQCYSCGWLIKQTETSITIAGSRNPDDYGDLTTIPNSNVKKIYKLRRNGVL